MSEPPRVTGSPGLKSKPADTRVLSSPNGLEHEQNLFRILYAHTIIFRLCIILSTMQMLLKPLLTCRSRGIERRKRIVYMWCTDAAIGGQTTLLTRGWIHTYKAVIYTGSTPLWPNFLSAEFFITGNYFAAGASMSPFDIRNTFFFLPRSICFRRNVKLREFRMSVKRKNGSLGSFSFCNKNKPTLQYGFFVLSSLRTKA